MVLPFFPLGTRPAPQTCAIAGPNLPSRPLVVSCALTAVIAMLLAPIAAASQVITIDTSGKAAAGNAPIDKRYAQIKPTNVPLPAAELDTKSRLELIRLLQAEQGFAMRPFPRGHKGLTLEANGKLEPAGEAYLNMIVASGTSARPGDRVVITDIKFDHSKMIFLLNGGPDPKHRFLRHISIGADPTFDRPVVADDGQEPVGARLTLDFGSRLPALTGSQVKALLAPLISFDVKTPIQAFTDTLPPELKDAILNHHVMVGMSTEMVMFAKGVPESKSREMEGQMPFEEWIYGKPPEEVDFVRINGNRVIRVEIAKTGEPPVIFTKDVVSGMLRTDGTPLETAADHTHISKVGDVERDPDKQAPAPPPSLRLPSDQPQATDQAAQDAAGQKNVGVMRPVQAPVKKPEYQPDYNPDGVPDSTPAASPAPGKQISPPAGTGQPN